jgi:hypothetical protein
MIARPATIPCQTCEHGPCWRDCEQPDRAPLWPAPPGDTHALRSTLAMALGIMRADLRSQIEVMVDRDRITARRSVLATLDRDQLALVLPLMACIRRAEAIIGRQPDKAPQWLDALIDGEMT